ncbi:purine-nucleoside phosphorylase [Promicromonospora sp. AC04]|uniref:purine-nucleoside phosphorylase n=1 Tax=Promicromonospora sp. AC04 TaxID=2135723 RepID=UPI000D335F77|nr:purine-nucleoside phosphorylase [Promicromonospora sp. AC04]
MSMEPDLDDPTTDPFDVAAAAAEYIAAKTGVQGHDIALVLGSGWGGAAELIGDVVAEIPTAEIPGFVKPAVEGHRSTTRSIRIERPDGAVRHALVLGSRTHLYEGLGIRRVAHGVRTAAAAGCETVILTNGCGSVHIGWRPGQVVLIKDHLNFTGQTPLEGAKFADMTDIYTPRLREIARSVDPDLPEGVYAQFHGPQYETPAEVKMASLMGADLVGMSTAMEAVAARHCRMDVLGISLATNLAAGISPNPLSHEEVLEAGREAGPRISDLLARVIKQL